MCAAKEEVAASVSTRQVMQWDKQDVLRWVKTYQDREAFEGTGRAQFNVMNSIINRKRLTGKQLDPCDTLASLKKLFNNKINSVTARILLDSLKMERSMFQKRELSKSVIKKNQWKPRVGEKIRLVEMKYKPPYRSYPATIKKILVNDQ
eukprot:232348_1